MKFNWTYDFFLNPGRRKWSGHIRNIEYWNMHMCGNGSTIICMKKRLWQRNFCVKRIALFWKRFFFLHFGTPVERGNRCPKCPPLYAKGFDNLFPLFNNYTFSIESPIPRSPQIIRLVRNRTALNNPSTSIHTKVIQHIYLFPNTTT